MAYLDTLLGTGETVRLRVRPALPIGLGLAVAVPLAALAYLWHPPVWPYLVGLALAAGAAVVLSGLGADVAITNRRLLYRASGTAPVVVMPLASIESAERRGGNVRIRSAKESVTIRRVPAAVFDYLRKP